MLGAPAGISTNTRLASSSISSIPFSLRRGTLPVSGCANSSRPDSGSGPTGTRPSCGEISIPEYSSFEAIRSRADACQGTPTFMQLGDTYSYAPPGSLELSETPRMIIRGGEGRAWSPPFRGSRAKPAPGWLKRSAAVRGRSPREEGFQGEETHYLLTSSLT